VLVGDNLYFYGSHEDAPIYELYLAARHLLTPAPLRYPVVPAQPRRDEPPDAVLGCAEAR